MDWQEFIGEPWFVGLVAVATLALTGVGVHFARRQTLIAAREQKARIEAQRRTEPTLPEPEPRQRWPLFTNTAPDLDRPILGRESLLLDIEAALQNRPGAALTQAAALHASGGMGKTSLARLYVQRAWKRYEGIWWVPAERVAEDLVPAIDALGARLGLVRDPANPQPAKDRAAAVWAAVAARGAPWLVVFDNAPDFATVREWLPHGARVRLLVTSRHNDFPPGRIPTLPVDILSPEAAATVLEAEAARPGDRAGAMALAEELGHLPLALVIAGAYARETGLSFEACRARIAEIIRAKPPTEYPDSVYASLALTLARIDADTDTGPDEWALLRLLPWLAPEGIDAKLVLDVAKRDFVEDSAEQIPDAIHTLAADPPRLHRAITRLEARALVAASGEGAARQLALHRVTALVLRARLAEEAGALRAGAAAVVAAGYKDAQNAANWSDCNRLNPHLDSVLNYNHNTIVTEHLAVNASIYWSRQGNYELATRYAEKYYLAIVRRAGASHADTGAACATMGRRYIDLGLWRNAVVFTNRALEIAQAQGNDYPHLPAALGNRADALDGLARTSDDRALASTYQFQALKDRRRALRMTRMRLKKRKSLLPTATPINETKEYEMRELFREVCDLLSSCNTFGRHHFAKRLAGIALKLAERHFPNGHEHAMALHNHGVWQLWHGAPGKAEPSFRQALGIQTPMFQMNPRHPGVTSTARWLAISLFVLGRESEASALCDEHSLNSEMCRQEAADYNSRAD